MSECKRQGKKLLEIESQEENNMLSELLYSSSRVTNVMDEVADLKMFLRIFVLGLDRWGGIKHCQEECLVLAQQHR